jgi:hypothetical protein
MTEEKYTSIRLRQSTADQLKEIGRKGESYDDVVAWLLKNSKKRKPLYSTEYRARDNKSKRLDASSNESDYYRDALARKNLLDKVVSFQTPDTCPLCEKHIKNGEFVVYMGQGKTRRTIHKDCLEKNGVDVEETEMAHVKDG